MTAKTRSNLSPLPGRLPLKVILTGTHAERRGKTIKETPKGMDQIQLSQSVAKETLCFNHLVLTVHNKSKVQRSSPGELIDIRDCEDDFNVDGKWSVACGEGWIAAVIFRSANASSSPSSLH